MKKNIKRFFIAIFLIILTCIIFLIAFNGYKEYKFYKNYGSSKATVESKIVGTVSLYSSSIDRPRLERLTGHSWIYLYNTSEENIYLDDFVIKPNNGISIGTTAHPKMPHTGIWFNVEGYNSNYDDNIAITGNLYEEDLEYISTYLKYHDRWDILYNCTTFACEIWNNIYAGKENKFYSLTPKNLYKQIEKSEDYEYNKDYIINGETSYYNQ